jgi:hypothetical protein
MKGYEDADECGREGLEHIPQQFIEGPQAVGHPWPERDLRPAIQVVVEEIEPLVANGL